MTKLLLALALACASVFAQQTTKQESFNHHDHIPLAAVPTTTTDALINSSCSGTCGVTLTSAWFVNINSGTSVEVIVTCKATSVVMIDAVIPSKTAGGNNIPVQLPADGVFCATGLTWSASASGVNGTLSGKY